jgi:hypothetical protein
MSEQVKHTPGPWEVDDCGNVCGEGAALATVFGAEDFPCLPEEDYDAVNVECAANARLMAAAPELLAALRARVVADEHFRNCHQCGADLSGNVWFCGERAKLSGEACRLTVAAIAKAEGTVPA